MNPDFELAKSLLTAWGHAGETIIVYDPSRLTNEGREEFETIRGHLSDQTVNTIGVDLTWLPILFIFPSPDKLEQLERGFPVVIMGVEIENTDPRARGDRHDADLVKAAKHAFEIETFRLTGRQTSVEFAKNTRARTLTEAEAEYRAKQTIGTAVWRSHLLPVFDEIMRLADGLIDRGRRLAATFFGVAWPRDQIAIEKAGVASRIAESGLRAVDEIEGDNIRRARDMAWNRERAGIFMEALQQWGKNVLLKKPIGRKVGERLTNAVAERMTGSALMKVAISGNLQPSDVHKNLLIEAPRLEVGRLIGQLSRGRTIKLTSQQAKLLRTALIKRTLGCLESQSDSMNFLLGDAALTIFSLAVWMMTLDRIVATGIAEEIVPQAE